MNQQEHIFFGIIAFLIYIGIFYFIIKNAIVGFFFSIVCVIFAIVCVIIGSILPDKLEPADNWMHRRICHSIRALNFFVKIFVVTAIISLISIVLFRNFLVFYVSCLVLGYTVHLLADSTTQVGLPD